MQDPIKTSAATLFPGAMINGPRQVFPTSRTKIHGIFFEQKFETKTLISHCFFSSKAESLDSNERKFAQRSRNSYKGTTLIILRTYKWTFLNVLFYGITKVQRQNQRTQMKANVVK